jgi:hypothetical protein
MIFKARDYFMLSSILVGIFQNFPSPFLSLSLTKQGIKHIFIYKNSERTDDLIRNWLRNRNTLEFLGIWEQLNNPGFNPVEFDGIRMQAGLNSFTLTPKQWREATGAIGISSKAGRYGGTFAHKDIAFEFASWVSVEFKLYLILLTRRVQRDAQKRAPDLRVHMQFAIPIVIVQ